MPIWVVLALKKVLPFIKEWWPQIAAAVAVAVFLFYFSSWRYDAGETAGRESVQEAWDKQMAKDAKLLAQQQRDARKVEETNARIAKEIQDGLQAKLDAASADQRTLSERVRYYQRRSCKPAVPATPGTAPVADTSPGVAPGSTPAGEIADSIGEATDNYYATCARDAVRLSEWQRWYEGVRK